MMHTKKSGMCVLFVSAVVFCSHNNRVNISSYCWRVALYVYHVYERVWIGCELVGSVVAGWLRVAGVAVRKHFFAYFFFVFRAQEKIRKQNGVKTGRKSEN